MPKTNFEVTEVSEGEVLHLNVQKSSTSSSIPATVLKQSIEVHLVFMANYKLYNISNGKFFKFKFQIFQIQISNGKWQIFQMALSMNHYYLFYYKWPCLILTQCFLNNYADENNLYSTENNVEMAKMDLQTYFREITDWFFENMILNSEKGY